MPMLIIQLAILIAAAFVFGCVLGRLIKGRKAADQTREDTVIAAALSTPALSEKPESVPPLKEAGAEEPLQQASIETTVKAEEIPKAVEEKEPEAEAQLLEATVAEVAVVEVKDPARPELLNAPSKGEPDDLTAISGIGKSVETMLNKLGIYHYAQIAQWDLDQAAWVERQIGFVGRVTRENWSAQANKLAQTLQQSAPKKRAKPKKAAAKSKVSARIKKI